MSLLAPMLTYGLFQPEEQSRRFAHARSVMTRFVRQLIEDKRRELAEDASSKLYRRKRGDFLTLVVEANMGNLLPEGEKLSDETIIDGAHTYYCSRLHANVYPPFRMHYVRGDSCWH